MVVRVVGEPRETHPFDAGIVHQIVGDRARVGLMTFEAQRQSFESLEKLKGVKGREGRAGVTKFDLSSTNDKRALWKVSCKNDVVESNLRLVKSRESFRVVGPGERSTV